MVSFVKGGFYMTDSKAMMAMFDAFDNANQGLAIWDENDNLDWL